MFGWAGHTSQGPRDRRSGHRDPHASNRFASLSCSCVGYVPLTTIYGRIDRRALERGKCASATGGGRYGPRLTLPSREQQLSTARDSPRLRSGAGSGIRHRTGSLSISAACAWKTWRPAFARHCCGRSHHLPGGVTHRPRDFPQPRVLCSLLVHRFYFRCTATLGSSTKSKVGKIEGEG